jgi:uncharacterized protein YfaS (alpha-2-macroglobulin family)
MSDHIHHLADAYIHGVLDDADDTRLEMHCEACPECKQAVADARKRLALLRAVPPTEAPPPLIDATMRHINDTLRRRARLKKRLIHGFFGAAAAAALVLALAHSYTQHMQPSPYDLAVLGQRDLFAATTASLRVRLLDRTTNRPVANVPVTVELIGDRGRGQQLASFTTDAHGSGELTFRLPDWSGNFDLCVRADTPQGEEVVTRPVRLHRAWKVMLSTDKPVYQPGQTIHARTLALRALDQKPAKQLPALFTLIDPKGNLLFKHEGETSKFGIAATDCRLASEILEGTYTLVCKVGDTESRRAVEVKKYVLPKFKVEVRPDRPYYRPKETAKVVVQADYFFGQPIADAEVVIEVRGRAGDKPIHEEKLRTDAKGRGEFQYTMPDPPGDGLPDLRWSSRLVPRPDKMDWMAETPLLLEAHVTDSGGQKQTRALEVVVTNHPVRVSLVPETGTLVQNVPNTVYVLTTRADGLPLSLGVKVADFDELHTDALGVGSFVVTPTSDSVRWEVKARDRAGELLASEQVVLTTGVSSDDFLLRTDRAVYRGGDTMRLSVRAAKDRPVYVDVVKDGQTLLTRAIDVSLGTGMASVDLPPELCGTLQLCAYRLRDDDRLLAQRTRVVYVHPAGQLKIETTLDRDEYRPRGDAKINFRVTDARGGAAPGVLSIAAVDEAVFSVLAQRPGREQHFYTVDDALLAPAYRLRQWSPEVSDDDEAHQRLQQALFAATAARAEPARVGRWSNDEPSLLPSHSLSGASYPVKVRELEQVRDARMEYIWFGWLALGAAILLSLDISLWLFFRVRWLLEVHVLGFTILFAGGALLLGTVNKSRESAARSGRVAEDPLLENQLLFDASFSTGEKLVPTLRSHSSVRQLFNTEDLGGHASDPPRVRDYFPETLAWRPHLVTDDDGRASLDLELADSITTWRLSASAVTADGRLGATERPLKVFQPFFVDVNLPVSLTRGDEIAVPIVVYNYLDKPQTVALSLTKSPWFTLLDDAEQRVELAAGQVRSVAYRLRVEKAGEHELTVSARAGEVGDAVKRRIEVEPDGRRVEVVHNGTLDPAAAHDLALPRDAIDGSGKALVKIYPSDFSEVVEGLDGIFRLPHGCFEQTSSTTYPNVLALDYLRRTKQASPAAEKKAKEYIHLGYQRLVSFEVHGGGFSLFGHAPADVQLTAYGLMEFQDMARVGPVDPKLIERTREWLLKQRADDGSWGPRGFGGDDARLRLTAYVAWAVFSGPSAEDGATTRRFLLKTPPERLDDPYLLALLCNALLALDPSGRDAAPYVERLDSLKRMEKNVRQASWSPAANGRTLYHAWGESGTAETTALAALALLKDGRHPNSVRLALAWLAAHKDAHGTWPTTQATVLALKALLAGTDASLGGDKERRFVIRFGDDFTKELVVPGNQADVLQMIDLSKHLTAEPQRLTITETSGTKSAYQVAFRYHEPATLDRPEDRPLRIAMKFSAAAATVGDTITATATATNRTGQAAPMAMLELPVPVGFTLAGDDFEQLVEKKVIAKYERTPRGVLVYLTELREELTLTYHLRATTPARGTTTPARVYEYYNPRQEGRSEQALLVVKDK